MTKDREFATFAEFWPFYVGQHRRPLCRGLHYLGGASAVWCLCWGLWTLNFWLLLLVPVLGYGPAWMGHFFVERNRPATFGWFLWSLRAEFRMLRLGLSGRMAGEVTRLFGSPAPAPDAPLLQQR